MHTVGFSSDHRKFIQMNWLSEFCLPLPGVRANQAKARTHPHNCSGPKSSRTSGPVDSSIWSLFLSGWVVFVMGHVWELFPNSLDFIPSLWAQDFSVPCRSEKKGAVPLHKGHKERPHRCDRQAGRRLRKMASLDTETERPRG